MTMSEAKKPGVRDGNDNNLNTCLESYSKNHALKCTYRMQDLETLGSYNHGLLENFTYEHIHDTSKAGKKGKGSLSYFFPQF